MPSSPKFSISSLANQLLDQWERFLLTERDAFALPDPDTDSPLYDTMADLDLFARNAIALTFEQGLVSELHEACLEALEERSWTLPMLARLSLLFADEILDYPLHLDRSTDVRWEILVIPANGRREDLHCFNGPEFSEALNAMGLAPINGTAVLLGVSTPDDLLAFMSDPDEVMAWRRRCENAPNQMPTPEGLPLLTLEASQPDEAHVGAFVYVVGLVERYDPDSGPENSLVRQHDYETLEERWDTLLNEWESRSSTSLALAEPDDVWAGCVYAITAGLVQSLYIQHAIGSASPDEEQPPVFAIVVNADAKTSRAVAVFPDRETISVPLDDSMVMFLPALMECPDFEFELVAERNFRQWIQSVTGEEEPSPVKPRRLS